MSSGPVVLDLQSLQSPGPHERGSSAYAYELAVALEREHPHLVGSYLLNPDLLPPGNLGPLLRSGKVAYPAVPAPPTARILHVLSPFAPGVPIDRIWPRWAHEQGLRFCVTMCNPIAGEYQGSSVAQLRKWTASAGTREILRNADALLTISPAQGRVLARNLGVDPSRVHLVGAGAEPVFSPAASRESSLVAARSILPELEPPFVLCPATSGERENLEVLIVAFAGLPRPFATRSSSSSPVARDRPRVISSRRRQLRASPHTSSAPQPCQPIRCFACTRHPSSSAFLPLSAATNQRSRRPWPAEPS